MDITSRSLGDKNSLNDLNTFCNFLSLLINACEKMQADTQTTKTELRRAKRTAEETKRKAIEDRSQLAVANVAIGIAAGTAIFFSGGLALPILFGTGQFITSICSNDINSDFEKNVERIIMAVDQRSIQSKERARMIINKKKNYHKTLACIKQRGVNENEATFLAICGMINEMVEGNGNSAFVTSCEYPAILDSSQLGIRKSDLIQKLKEKKNIGIYGFTVSSSEKYIPEWLTNSTKGLAGKIPILVPKLVGVAATVITAGAEICSVIRFATSSNKAVKVIDETIELLNEGESSLDYFIGVFTTTRIHALQELKAREQKQFEEIQMSNMKKALLEEAIEKDLAFYIFSVLVLGLAYILVLLKL